MGDQWLQLLQLLMRRDKGDMLYVYVFIILHLTALHDPILLSFQCFTMDQPYGSSVVTTKTTASSMMRVCDREYYMTDDESTISMG